MTPEQQRIAIAQACGWIIIYRPEVHEHAYVSPDGIPGDVLPDYLNDLNAMPDAENVLTEEQFPQYREELQTVVLGGIRLISQLCKADLHATAAQRAEALLRALNLWIDPTSTN